MPVVLSSKSKRLSKIVDRDAELIKTSIKRWKITEEAESDTREKGLEDLKFSIGTGQWDEAVRANRELEGKPCLTVNRAPSFLRQYTGEERQHRPAMIVSPVGNGADQDLAKIHQGVLRHIEVASFADVVYDNAYDWMMRTGWSYWRADPQYIAEDSFFQEPKIEWIENQFSVFMSPIRKPDGSDPLWCHITRDYSEDEYKEEFGEKTVLTKLGFQTAGNIEPTWLVKDGGARVAEYWYLELARETLCLLADGTTKFKSQITDPAEKAGIELERETVARKICWVQHDAMQVLRRRDYLGKYIPIIELNGVRLMVEGKIYKAGMVRDYRDAQRIYDFMVTRGVEQIDLAGKDPIWTPIDNAQWGDDYRKMNRDNLSHLFYKAYNEDGKQLPPPSRASREPPIQAISAMIKQADYDMKAVIGIYGPGLGEQGPENESGFAILTRQQQSDTGMVTWHDNLNRTLVYQGKILLDIYPRVISKARVQRIVNPDDSTRHVAVYNSEYSSSEEANALLDGDAIKKVYDVGKGSYDCVLSAGPMYRTARQEAFKAIGAIVESKPELISIVGDVWVKNADWPDAHILADRFKKMLPPQLQDAADDDPKAQVTALQGQLAAMSMQHQQLTAELARATDTIRTDRLALESKERIASENARAGIIEALIKANLQAALEPMKAELGTIAHRMELLHESMSVEQEAGAATPTPELPSQVEPKVQPVTPAAPATPIPGSQ